MPCIGPWALPGAGPLEPCGGDASYRGACRLGARFCAHSLMICKGHVQVCHMSFGRREADMYRLRYVCFGGKEGDICHQ